MLVKVEIVLAILLLLCLRVFYVALKFTISDYRAPPSVFWSLFEIIMTLLVLVVFFYVYLAGHCVVSEASLGSTDIAFVGFWSSVIFAVMEGIEVRWSRKYSDVNHQ